MQFKLLELEKYLENQFGETIQIEEVREIGGETTGASSLKQFGYGRPLLVTFRVSDRQKQLVFHRIRHNAFGRERDDDRVAVVWLDFHLFNRLPRHVSAVDMLALTKDGKIRSLRSAEDLLLVTEYQPGQLYADDLARIRDTGTLRPLDIQRAEALAAYLGEIHQVKHEDPALWRRRLRDLIGHGEGIMGLTDSYPDDLGYATEKDRREIEEMANQWRWKLKPLHGRLRQVHGDFHPFNVLFKADLDFSLLDRSRGEWGEPADDVSCMTINYLFFSLQRAGSLEDPFLTLHNRFWERYYSIRPDGELEAVIQPWFAWRALVLASPIWYPTIPDRVRRMLLTFARRVMSTGRYDYRRVNDYLEGVEL